MIIRAFLLSLVSLVFAVVPASAGTGEDGERWHELRETLFDDRPIHEGTGVLTLEAPQRAHDAAVVPIAFEPAFPQTPDRYIRKVTLLVDENPLPMAGHFHFTPESGRASIRTRIRVNAYTHVRAIAETSDGELHMTTRYVKASGGCSAPAGKDPEASLARLGRMKLRRSGPVEWGEPNEAQILVSHPNHTGMQMDQVTHHYVLAHFVEQVDVRFRDEPVLTVETNFSLSEDPSIHFHFVPDQPGELSVRVTDSEGAIFARSWMIPDQVAEASDPGAGRFSIPVSGD